jgi:hypothetical protein
MQLLSEDGHQLLSGAWTSAAVRRWAPYSTQDFFGPQMALAYGLDAISKGQKKVSISRAQPLLLALVMDAAHIKSITHGAV